MKTLIINVLLFTSINVFADCGILSVEGPTIFCPGEEAKFTATYEFYNSLNATYPFPREIVYQVYFDFIQNGTLIKTFEASEFTKQTFCGLNKTGEAEITINKRLFGSSIITNKVDLKIGDFTVQARVRTYLYINLSIITPVEHKKSKTFTAGIVLGSLGSITGAGNICPGSSSIYSVPKLFFATSYTWEVPSGWLVNGINGPVVTGQSNSVSITAPPCYNPETRVGETSATPIACSPRSVVVKVKGVNSTCGNDESTYRSKTINYDYPFSISHTETSESTVTFYASPSGFPYYQWSFSDGWTAAYNNNYAVEVNHNDEGGTAYLTVKTYCNNYYSSSRSFMPIDCSQTLTAYPNPATSELMLTRPCEIEISLVAVEENGKFRKLEAIKNDGVYKIDVSALKPGLHILKTKNSKGEDQFIRFLKSK